MECGVFRKLGEVNNFWPLKFHSQDALVLSFDYANSQLLGILDPIKNSVEVDLFVSDSWNPRPTELTEPQGQNERFFNYQCYTANFSYVTLHYLRECREITSQYPRPALPPFCPASVLPAGSVGGATVINSVGRGLEPYSGQSFSLFLFGPVSFTKANVQKGISTHCNLPLNYLDISSL